MALADGEPGVAIAHFRDAATRWSSVGAPYEAARCRVGAARAAVALGDPGDAARQARSALATFEQLGARLDAEAASTVLDQLKPSAT